MQSPQESLWLHPPPPGPKSISFTFQAVKLRTHHQIEDRFPNFHLLHPNQDSSLGWDLASFRLKICRYKA